MNNTIGNAASYFIQSVADMCKGTYNSIYMIGNEYSYNAVSIEYLKNVPVVEAGRFVGSDDCGDGTYVFVWDTVTENDYNSYKSDLEAAGLTLSNTYVMGNSKHALYKNDKLTAYVSYIGNEEMIRVFFERAGTAYPSAEQGSYETVDVDSKNGSSDAEGGSNGGMCFIAKVADGSFIIIDGGYNTTAESNKILNFLKENTPEGQKPVVSAWIITHQHGDHYGALYNLTANHLNEFTVKAFYYNFPHEGHDGAGGTAGGIENRMAKWTGAVRYSKLHTGMRFYVADAQFDVMFTHEDLYPIANSNVNDTSMVLRLTLGGKRIMFLADIEDRASDVIERFQTKEEMKSDIVQVAHHGYEGASQKVYDMVEAATVLWPINTYSFQSNSIGSNIFEKMIKGGWRAVNKYLAQDATYVKTVICAEEAHWGAFKIELPDYVPRENRLPDYKDLYDRVKAEAEAEKNG